MPSTLHPHRPPKLADRGRAWRRHAKNTHLTHTDTHLALTKGRRTIWETPIGDQPGEIAACVRASGRINSRPVDYYVFVDNDGNQAAPAIRRAAPDSPPETAWWPLADMRTFLADINIPLRDRVFASATELANTWPDVAAAHG